MLRLALDWWFRGTFERQVGPGPAVLGTFERQDGPGTAVSRTLGRQAGPGTSGWPWTGVLDAKQGFGVPPAPGSLAGILYRLLYIRVY